MVLYSTKLSGNGSKCNGKISDLLVTTSSILFLGLVFALVLWSRGRFRSFGFAFALTLGLIIIFALFLGFAVVCFSPFYHLAFTLDPHCM